jgi:hypothetical protein
LKPRVTGGPAIRATLTDKTSAAAPEAAAPAAPAVEKAGPAASGRSRVPATRAPKRPKCAFCRTRLKVVPGKVAPTYCSESCRKRAKRVIKGTFDDPKVSGVETHNTAGQTAFSGPGTGPLGKETTEFPSPRTEPTREERARSRSARRYAGRRTLWQITGERTCRGCGRTVMDPDTGVLKAQTAEGYVVVLGLLKCGKIWFCPPCSAAIRNGRSAEVTKAVVAWIKAGGTAYLVTFTPRHAYTDRLDALMDALQGTRAATDEEISVAAAEADDAALWLRDTKTMAREHVDGARIAAPKGQKKTAMTAARAQAAEWVTDAEARVAAARQAVQGKRRQAGAYQRLITGGTWAGRPDRGEDGIRDRIGYIGMIRATEVTVGITNGWHPHIHAIVLVGGRTVGTGRAKKVITVEGSDKWDTFEPGETALREWEDEWRAVWTRSLAQVDPGFRPSDTCEIPGCKCNGVGHGVDFKRLETIRDAEAFGEYLAKTQDGKDPSNELTRADMKDAYGENMTPFQMLNRIGDLMGGMSEDQAEGVGTLQWCLAHWWEYEAAVGGRRAIEWTRWLRQLLGMQGGDTEEDDQDMLFQLDATSEFRAGVQVRTQAWHDVAAAGLDHAAVESVQGTNGIDLEAVTAVYEAAGAAPDSVRLLTGAEVDTAWETVRAALTERRQIAAARRAAATGTPLPTQKGGSEPTEPPTPLRRPSGPEPVNFLSTVHQATRPTHPEG